MRSTTCFTWLLLAATFGCKPTPLKDAPAPTDEGSDTTGDDDDDVSGDDDDDDGQPCGGCDDGQACVDDVCVECAPDLVWPSTSDPSAIHLVHRDVDPALDLLLGRPLEVLSPTNVAVGAGLSLVDTSGTPVDGALAAGDYLLLADAVGESDLTFSPPADCATGDHVVLVDVHEERAIVGRPLAQDPFVERVHLYGPGDVVALALDAVEHSDRVGQVGDFVVVPDRSAADWAADPTLDDAVFSTSLTAGVDTDAWTTLPTGAGLVGTYDIVLDLDQDGALSPGDLVQGLEGPAIGVAGDLAAPGPHATTEFEWSESYWITQKTYHPTDMTGLDPAPLVVISHGNGHDFRWYDYLGHHLASWGYVVTSHRNDTMPGPVTAAATTVQNTEAFLALLPSLGGGVLDGQVDGSRIAWIGHSRGGEGVVLAYDDLFDGAVTPSTFTAADIQLVSSIAPTIFQGPGQGNPNDVPYHLMAGSSDGDVTGAPGCDLCQYFRLFKNGTAESWVTYFQGSTHNDFHDDVPGSFDDGIFVSGVKIGSQLTQTGAKAYYLALLQHVMEGDELLDEYLERPPELFRPSGVNFVLASSSWRSGSRLVIDDFQSEPMPSVSSSGGAVTGDIGALVEGLADDANSSLATQASDPMNGFTWAHNDGADSERCGLFEWDQGDHLLEYELTGPRTDASIATHLSMRVAQATRHPFTDTLDGMLSFTVGLVDVHGTEVSFDTRAWGGVPKPARRSGGGTGAGSGWANEFQTLRIPLEAFTADGRGLDLAQLTHVRLRFGPSYGSAQGRIGFDDLEFLAEETP